MRVAARSQGGHDGLLIALSTGAVPLTQEGLDAYGSGSYVDRLCALLEHDGLLPDREPYPAHLEIWITAKRLFTDEGVHDRSCLWSLTFEEDSGALTQTHNYDVNVGRSREAPRCQRFFCWRSLRWAHE